MPCGHLRVVAAAALTALITTGCAGWDGVLELTPPAAVEPAEGLEMRLGQIRDERVFRERSGDTWTPTLSGDAIGDRSHTASVLGRRGKSTGQLAGNLFATEGETVETLVAEAIASAYRRAGYRVITTGNHYYDEALPIDAQIREFWTRYRPVFGQQPRVEFRISVRIESLPEFIHGTTITCFAELAAVRASEPLYTRLVDQGLERFTEALRARLSGDPRVVRCE